MSCESRVGSVWMNKSHLSASIPSLHRWVQNCEQPDRVSSTVIHRLSTLGETRRMEPSQMVDARRGGPIRGRGAGLPVGHRCDGCRVEGRRRTGGTVPCRTVPPVRQLASASCSRPRQLASASCSRRVSSVVVDRPSFLHQLGVFLFAYMTVGRRLPNSCPIFGSDRLVMSRHRLATARGSSARLVISRPYTSSTASAICSAVWLMTVRRRDHVSLMIRSLRTLSPCRRSSGSGGRRDRMPSPRAHGCCSR